jgi:hypothetical protein
MNIVPCKNHFFVSQRVAVTSEQKTWHVHSSKNCPLVSDAPLQNRVKNAVMNKYKAARNGAKLQKWGYRTGLPFFDSSPVFQHFSPVFRTLTSFFDPKFKRLHRLLAFSTFKTDTDTFQVSTPSVQHSSHQHGPSPPPNLLPQF